MKTILAAILVMSFLVGAGDADADRQSRKRLWLDLQVMGREIGQVKACMQAYATTGEAYEQYWPAYRALTEQATALIISYVSLGAGGAPEPGAWHGAWEALVRAQVGAEDATDRAGCSAVLEAARILAAEKSSAQQ